MFRLVEQPWAAFFFTHFSLFNVTLEAHVFKPNDSETLWVLFSELRLKERENEQSSRKGATREVGSI